MLDHDPEILPESRAKQLVSEQIDMAYADIRRPIEFSTVPFSQLYDLNTCLLPDRRHFAPLYATEEKQFRLLFGDAVRQYSMAMKPDVFINSADILSSYLTPNPADQLPAERELNDTFSCNAVMNAVLEKHRSTAKQWKATVDAGRVIRNFGTENDRLVEHTLLVYDKDAAACKSSKAFQRKRDELSTFLLSDSYALFAKQILKVRENAYQVFRAKLARIRINDQVEKNVRAAVKEAEAFFVEHAESLRSKLSNWRFDNERHELVNHMRDDATERLQLARLQGNYVPRMRSPIAFAFHTLLLAPFGRDSRFSHPHAEDMKQSYDPDKVKRAGLMRARPHQRGHNICVGGRDEVDDVFLEKFADLFGDVSDDK